MNNQNPQKVEVDAKRFPLVGGIFIARKEDGLWILQVGEDAHSAGDNINSALERYKMQVHLYGELNVKLLGSIDVRTEVAAEVRYVGEPFPMGPLIPVEKKPTP